MKYFFDTEFIEHEGGINLISIGIVSELGHEFYAISTDFDPEIADDWVKQNVLAKLPERHVNLSDPSISPRIKNDSTRWMGERWIREQIVKFIGDDDEPEFYAYFADYDWVVFCRLFGRMIDLPKTFPMWCRDLKQMMWERGLDSDWKDEHVPQNGNEHDALADAKWNFELYKKIVNYF
jgi:hypothetical protein